MPQKKDVRTTQLKDLQRYEENPFVDNLGSLSMAKKQEYLYQNGRVVVNTDTGEVEDVLGVARVRFVEDEEFVKVYRAQLQAWFELAAAGQRVAEFVLHQMSFRAIGKGEVMLTFYDYKKHFEGRKGGSKSTYMRGLQELADKGIVARARRSDDLWYINPSMAFNGDRARFVTEFRRKKKSTQEQLEDEGQGRLLE